MTKNFDLLLTSLAQKNTINGQFVKSGGFKTAKKIGMVIYVCSILKGSYISNKG